MILAVSSIAYWACCYACVAESRVAYWACHRYVFRAKTIMARTALDTMFLTEPLTTDGTALHMFFA